MKPVVFPKSNGGEGSDNVQPNQGTNSGSGIGSGDQSIVPDAGQDNNGNKILTELKSVVRSDKSERHRQAVELDFRFNIKIS